MGWLYTFNLKLADEQKHQRHELIDRYAVYAQLSAFVPMLVFLLFKLVFWAFSASQRASVQYEEVPSSPAAKRLKESKSRGIARKWRSALWWLETEVHPGWGLRGQWVAAVAWTVWSIFLCVHRTGHDYFHFTKRFGMIGVSQLPLHYMRSIKSFCSPLAFLFRSSHEQVNPWHRLFGRIIYFLLFCHAALYLNFYIQTGVLLQRLTESRVVIVGLSSIFLLTLIATSSLAPFRRWSYRVFFLIHLMIGLVILPLLFFQHSPFADIYLVARKLDTVRGFARINKVPHTKLHKLSVLVPTSKIKRYNAAPGQHVYLSIPPESTPPNTSSVSIHELLFNPFSIAHVSSKEITLVLRVLGGPTTKALDALTKLSKARPPINIEGPYGTSRRFPNLIAYDRILLVAGGVGATYILPIYRELQHQLDAEGKNSDCIAFIWSMRSAAEAAWAVDLPEEDRNLEDDEKVKIFVTGTEGIEDPEEAAPADGSVELEDLQAQPTEGIKVDGGRKQRPDLGRIVDETFRKGKEEKVAVLVCGPTKMAEELRRHVGRWVESRREVWWHDEGFGW